MDLDDKIYIMSRNLKVIDNKQSLNTFVGWDLDCLKKIVGVSEKAGNLKERTAGLRNDVLIVLTKDMPSLKRRLQDISAILQYLNINHKLIVNQYEIIINRKD